jgi:hypothetical protein
MAFVELNLHLRFDLGRSMPEARAWVDLEPDGTRTRAHRSAGIILAKNKTGGNRARLHVMGIRFPVDGEGDVHNGPRGVNEDIKS